MNIAGTLYADAVRAGCRLYQNDMKLRVEDNASFHPDVMLVCDRDSGDNDAETSPCLLVEVVSQSTAAHDRFGKYGVYTAIPSLRTSLIVEQKERRVYAYGRQEGGWTLQDLSGSGGIEIACLGRRLTLDETYLGVL